MKKTYAYRLMMNCEPPGTLLEGGLQGYHEKEAQRNAQKKCRDQVIVDQGDWTHWGERNGIFGCSFRSEATGYSLFRLALTEVPDADTPSEATPLMESHPLFLTA